MNKRKLLTLAMTLCMVAILAIGGTLAYFTDTDMDVNVMTAGNVTIVQNETQRDGSAYEDGKALLPAVYLKDGKPYNPTTSWEGPAAAKNTYTGPDGEEIQLWDDALNNEIDKIISVTNTGSLPAYVRTFVVVEGNDGLGKNLHYLRNGSSDIDFLGVKGEVEVNGEVGTYNVWAFTYKNPLEVGDTTPASLMQIWLDPMTDNDWYAKLGTDKQLTMIAFSQAVQTEGFTTAQEALDTAFGEFTEENLAQWLKDLGTAKTTDELNVVGGGN